MLLCRSLLQNKVQSGLSDAETLAIMTTTFQKALVNMLPFFAIFFVGKTVSQFSIGGLVLSTQKLKFDINKLNPVKGLNKIFDPSKAGVELLRSILKIAFIGTIAAWTLLERKDVFTLLMGVSVDQSLPYVGETVTTILKRVLAALLFLAILDIVHAKYSYEKELKMSKQEVKEEFKREEGDPIVKSRMRSMQRQTMLQRMKAEVKEADVVVVNPTSIAVAIRYEPLTDPAPVVTAKGKFKIAEKIREEARRHGIPIIRNKQLAQMLFRFVPIGEAIPPRLFQAVAEILATVYRMKGDMPENIYKNRGERA